MMALGLVRDSTVTLGMSYSFPLQVLCAASLQLLMFHGQKLVGLPSHWTPETQADRRRLSQSVPLTSVLTYRLE